MKIKVTPFDNRQHQLKIDIRIKNNFYGGSNGYCGIITEIKKSDDWLDQEMPWVSRSEIPFVTALRLSQLDDECNMMLIAGLLPITRDYGLLYIIKEVPKFPNRKDCISLLNDYCKLATTGSYDFQRTGNEEKIIKIFKSFDYKNNLLMRAGSCLYKANILLRTSSIFSEEVYINAYIAFEGIIEYLKLKYNISRKNALQKISLLGIDNFDEYEEEMRDFIRNDIIHPYRNKYKQKIPQPFIMADYILEDLAFIDWLFKQLLENKIK